MFSGLIGIRCIALGTKQRSYHASMAGGGMRWNPVTSERKLVNRMWCAKRVGPNSDGREADEC